MKTKSIYFLALGLLTTQAAFADDYVHGYTRKDGTYVQPYFRSEPNNTTTDNYSTRGNFNPYTGNSGTVSPNQTDDHKLNGSTGTDNSYGTGE